MSGYVLDTNVYVRADRDPAAAAALNTFYVLLAVSCREHGYTLVTANVGDFGRIREVLDFAFVRPWPPG